MSRKYLYVLLFILTALLAAVTFFYYFNNFKGSFSSKSDDWGDFGSYIAGTLGIVLSTANFIFLYLTFREQQVKSDRQQFESSFFNLIKIHQDFVTETSDYKKRIDHQTADNEKLKGYELLEYYRQIEEGKMVQLYFSDLKQKKQKNYLKLFGDDKYLLNYQLRKNEFILGKEYLRAVYESIIAIYTFIKDSTMIKDRDKPYFFGILSRALRQSEKFILFAFYIQEDRRKPAVEPLKQFDINLLCKLEDWQRKFIDPSSTYKYPYSWAGLSPQANGAEVQKSIVTNINERVYRGYCYKFFSLDQFEIDEVVFSSSMDNGEVSFPLNFMDISDGAYLHLGEILNAFLKKMAFSPVHDQSTDPATAFLRERKKLELSLHFDLNFVDEEPIKITIFDKINFVLEGDDLLIECFEPYHTGRLRYTPQSYRTYRENLYL